MNPQTNTPIKTPPPKEKTAMIGPLIVGLIIGLMLIGVGVYTFFSALPPSDYEQVEGKVLGADPQFQRNVVYAPIVLFWVDGLPYSVTGTEYISAKPIVDETLQVFYDPFDPNKAQLASNPFDNTYVFSLPITGIGFILFSIFSYTKAARRDKNVTTPDVK
ncbi:MAG: hypothetical protein KIG14_01375 [Candidatus Sacchiramonaceae bacterium]|nr:hypothetical protein [Candidatus Saccharimonadaceae bacterium]